MIFWIQSLTVICLRHLYSFVVFARYVVRIIFCWLKKTLKAYYTSDRWISHWNYSGFCGFISGVIAEFATAQTRCACVLRKNKCNFFSVQYWQQTDLKFETAVKSVNNCKNIVTTNICIILYTWPNDRWAVCCAVESVNWALKYVQQIQ